jgi:hypothetical protein
MDTYIRPRSGPVAEIAAKRQCAECALRPTWKGNLFTLFVVAVVLGLIFS